MTALYAPQRAVHLDFHTMPQVYDVGRDFEAGAFARTLRAAQVDYITVFAKCNLGFTYYPTQVGTVHPGLQQELLGPMIAACHQEGIRVAAYLNVGLDHEGALRHREWCKVNAQGQVYDVSTMGHFFRRMCLNSSYGAHMLAMISEVLERYAVDGIFLDCFTLDPCYGVECLDGMQQRGMNALDEGQARAFCWESTRRFTEQVNALVQRVRPGINVYFNGLPYRWQPTHLELEILPTGGWGYDYLPWVIRYARTVGKPYFTMTGRFHGSWGDFGGLRPYQALLYDCYNSIANGGTCSVGDHMHPRGKLEEAVYDLVGRVYTQVQALEPWTKGAQTETEIAILVPGAVDAPASLERTSLAGAARMLMELKCQFDVCDAEVDLAKYRVLILPDHVRLDARVQAQLQAHLVRGGGIISSADAGLDEAQTRFALDDYGVTYEGPEPYDPSFFVATDEVGQGLPHMPTTIYMPGVALRAAADAQVLAHLYRPYFNTRVWDRRHETMYMPPEQDTGRPALVQRGRIIHCSFPIFQGYYEHAVVAYKTLLGNCLARLLPEPLVKVEHFPSFGQVTVTRQGQRRMVHLLAYVPELRGHKVQMVEEPIQVGEVKVALRQDGHRVSKVYLAPEGQELPFHVEGQYVCVTVPEMAGYRLVVFEPGAGQDGQGA